MCCIIAFRDCSELLLFFPCAVCRSLYRLQRQITSGCWHEFRGSCSFNCKSTQVSTLSYRHNTTTMWGSMVSQKPCLRFYDWDLLNMRVQFLLPLTQGLLVYCCGPYFTLSTWLLMKVIYILVICIALGIFLQFSYFYQNHHYSNFTWNQGLKSYLVDLPQYICT